MCSLTYEWEIGADPVVVSEVRKRRDVARTRNRKA